MSRRRLDSFTIWLLIFICTAVVSVRAFDLLQDGAQLAVNATLSERIVALTGRIEHLERMSDGTFLAIVGVLVSQIITLRRRPEQRASPRVTED